MGRLFGTDGVRGVANQDLTPDLAYKLGKAGAHIIAGEKAGKFIVGTDTRISCDMLKAALSAGICSRGFDVLDCGIIPTPAVAYLTREFGIGGVVISASHNPYYDNGIKFFNGDGFKLTDSMEDEIELLLDGDIGKIPTPSYENVGRIISFSHGFKDYVDFLVNTVNIKLEGYKIALDCAHGATYKVAPTVFKRLGAQVKVINNKPNGLNINVNSGSTHIESLKEFAVKNDCNFGFAFDGDGDRVIAVDNKGKEINGDKILAILAEYFKGKGLLKGNLLISTVMSNIGLEIAMKEKDIKIIRSAVGDRYVLEEMQKTNAILGGEQSGHVICSLYNTTGDGLLTALLISKVSCESKKDLTELASGVIDYPQILVNVKVKDKNNIIENSILKGHIVKAEETLRGRGRILIRPSGTEPLVRVMVEGTDQELIENIANQLVDIINHLDKN